MSDQLANPLSEPLRSTVGGTSATLLAERLGLRTAGDLLHHYPRRYAERGELTRLNDLEVGEHATVLAEVASTQLVPMRKRKGNLFKVRLTDGYGHLDLVFFQQSWHQRKLWTGRRGMFAGKVEVFQGKRQLAHPDYQVLDEDSDGEAVERFANRLIPIYPAAAKCESWRVAAAVETLLDQLNAVNWAGTPDPLPHHLRQRRDMLDLPTALEKVHRPRGWDDQSAAQQRLKWDEAFVLQVALARRRAADQALPALPRRPAEHGMLTAFDARIPFALTAGQREVCAEIFDDLAAEHPMHRLLQGEVGSGKTVVALRAMLAVLDSGGQAALLAPTEVLAQQHHRSITALLGPLAERGMLTAQPQDDASDAARGTRVALLTGSLGAKARRAALLDLASGDAGIVVGTHALIEDRVQLRDLGLVVVDEQHRFGVRQRDALRSKAAQPPHMLVMTATPIPRTVAMTAFGDLRTSALTQLPSGRAPIVTHVVPAAEKPHFLTRAWERVREEVAAGHQAYVVCPRVGDEPGIGTQRRGRTDEAEAAPAVDATEPAASAGSVSPPEGEHGDDREPPLAVLDVVAELAAGPLAGLRVEALHGRMAAEDKDARMRRFAAGDVDVLVSTTVIEVGVDVPNATAMVVLDAERFGVSQLHQLRGRVGRGGAAGLCLLVSQLPDGSAARARLDAVASTTDGFELSRIDLEQRREGDVLGQAQSGGRSSLRMLTVSQDEEVIAAAREEASALVEQDPELTDHPALRVELDSLVEEDRADYLERG